MIYKILQRLIKDHMVDFLNKSICTHKSVVMLNKYNYYVLEEITKWVDEGSPVNIIYLVIQKAFDKVPHQNRLLKLNAHGTGDGIINWVKKWFTDRRQLVIVDWEE